jgi:type II restriction enzyme
MFLLHYDRIKWTVENLMVIHRSCITTSCIIPRKPLSSNARRAGWQGCTYSLDRIPKLGQIQVINQGLVREKAEILAQWKQSDSLLGTKPELRGWVAEVLTCVERLPSIFKLDEIYAFEDELGEKHRDNHHIRPKIRQQLQVLRDLGLVNFVSPGVYEYLGKQTIAT